MKKIIVGLSVCTGIWAQSSDLAKQMTEQKQMAGQFAGGVPQFGPIGIQAAMAGPVNPVAGAPYSAEAVTERVQTLADGNRIVQTSSSTVARDGQGRIRRDESLAIALPGGKGDAPKLEMIDDPVTGVQWRLDPQTKTAVKMVFPKLPSTLPNGTLPPPGAESTWFYSSGAPGSQITIETLAKRKAETDTNVNRLDLGTQTVEGVPAQGTRITRTIPSGEVGNEQPLIITTETWYSPSLKVLVMSKAEDPRMGVTTYRLTNIQRSEPPASLFEIPADYTIKDQPANTFFFRETKKVQ
jgi:hypothetical protein